MSQAGLVEKFVDALVWVIFPVFLVGQGASLTEIGWIVGCYGFVWGGSQLFTGRLSDHVGRFWPNVLGMWICGAGVAMVVLGNGALWWSVSAGVAGFGMALLYPNLRRQWPTSRRPPGAARPSASTASGAISAMASARSALGWPHTHRRGRGGLLVRRDLDVRLGAVLFWLGEETHPRLNPAPQGDTT